MNSLCSISPWSLEYVPPSADYLYNLQVEDKNLDIEDGLCSPNDQEVFLTASMAFLQSQLLRKLKNDIRTEFEKTSPRRTFSDLLLVESHSKFRRQKYFIRVKNVERYDEILKNEAATPSPRQTLSLHQLLPAPKKTLWLNSANLFRTRSSKASIGPSSEMGKSYNFFGSLKRSLFRSRKGCSPTESQYTLNDVNMRCQLYVNALPSKTSVSTLNSLKNYNQESNISLLALNRIKMAPSFVNPLKVMSDDSNTILLQSPETSSSQIQLDSLQSIMMNLKRNKKLSQTRRELEISKFLSGQQTRTLKQPLSESVREIKNHYNYIHTREAPSYETFTSSSTVNVLARCSAQTKLKTQQSKMSVFLEEDSLSDEDEGITDYSSLCTNFTDEFKSRFSSEYVPSLFVKRFIDKSKSDLS